jgi:hypothetical protein
MSHFNWTKKQHNTFQKYFETLYKDPLTGAKKWVIIPRNENIDAPRAQSRVEFYGPDDDGPFGTEIELIHHLPHLTFTETCPVCTHKMTFVAPVGVEFVNCTKCGKEIEVPSTFKSN